MNTRDLYSELQKKQKILQEMGVTTSSPKRANMLKGKEEHIVVDYFFPFRDKTYAVSTRT